MQEFLREHTLMREEVDQFLDESAPNWGVFDSELGYTLKSSFIQDGIDGTWTLATYTRQGYRHPVNYADHPCRIHTYGDSYTQCQQVSDGETWQEYLAGHLGEPIRNYGVGGYGVYQAYRRMVREESQGEGAPSLILGIFGIDDHYRSLDAWRRPRCGNWFRENPRMFHANPWDHVRYDLDRSDFVVQRNLLPTPESLYDLCDFEKVCALFAADIALNMHLGQQPGTQIEPGPLRAIRELAEAFDLPFDSDRQPEAIRELYRQYSLRATMRIVEWAQDFCSANNRRLMLLLMHGMGEIYERCIGKARRDQEFIAFLSGRGFRYVDVLEKHAEDFRAFSLDAEEYVRRYCIGHYNPQGNHFLAYAIRREVADWLNPKPVVYQNAGERMRFDEYLPGMEHRQENR